MDKRLTLKQPCFEEKETNTINTAFLERALCKFKSAEDKFKEVLTEETNRFNSIWITGQILKTKL